MVRKLILSVILFFTIVQLNAQIIILHENVKADTVVKAYGPNYKHFLQLVYAYGLLLGKPSAVGGAIKQPQSFFAEAKLQYKRKLGNYYALLINAGYTLQSFNLKQNKEKLIPDNVLHKKEKLLFNSINLSVLNRMNFGRTGNRIGKYVDAGMYGGYMFRGTHVTYDESLNKSIAKGETVIRNKGLTFVTNYNYGLMVRCGNSYLALLGYYRLSNIINANKVNIYPELPRFMVGVELSTM